MNELTLKCQVKIVMLIIIQPFYSFNFSWTYLHVLHYIKILNSHFTFLYYLIWDMFKKQTFVMYMLFLVLLGKLPTDHKGVMWSVQWPSDWSSRHRWQARCPYQSQQLDNYPCSHQILIISTIIVYLLLTETPLTCNNTHTVDSISSHYLGPTPGDSIILFRQLTIVVFDCGRPRVTVGCVRWRGTLCNFMGFYW